MVAVLVALGAAFLIWYHNDPAPPPVETGCPVPHMVTTARDPGGDFSDILFEPRTQTNISPAVDTDDFVVNPWR